MFRLNCGFKPQPSARDRAAVAAGDTLLIASKFTIQICQTQIARSVPRAHPKFARVHEPKYDTLRAAAIRARLSIDGLTKKKIKKRTV